MCILDWPVTCEGDRIPINRKSKIYCSNVRLSECFLNIVTLHDYIFCMLAHFYVHADIKGRYGMGERTDADEVDPCGSHFL